MIPQKPSLIALFAFIFLFTFSCTDEEEMGFQFPAKFVYDKVAFETFDHYEFDGVAFVPLSQTPELIALGELTNSFSVSLSDEIFHSVSLEILNDSTAITGNYYKHSQQIEYEQVSINMDELRGIYVGNHLLFEYDEDNKSFSACVYGSRIKVIYDYNGSIAHQESYSLYLCAEVDDILSHIIANENCSINDTLSTAVGAMIFIQE